MLNESNHNIDVPIWEKSNLTLKEAASYSGLGLMFAAGLGHSEVSPTGKKGEETVYDRFRSLPAKDRRTVEEFIEFLYSRSHQEQESHQDNQ